MNKKKVLLLVSICGLIIGGLIGFYKGFLGNPDRRLYNKIKDKPDLVAIFNKAEADEDQIRQHPDQASLYLDAGLKWKSIAELNNRDKDFYARSLAAYEQGIEKF